MEETMGGSGKSGRGSTRQMVGIKEGHRDEAGFGRDMGIAQNDVGRAR